MIFRLTFVSLKSYPLHQPCKLGSRVHSATSSAVHHGAKIDSQSVQPLKLRQDMRLVVFPKDILGWNEQGLFNLIIAQVIWIEPLLIMPRELWSDRMEVIDTQKEVDGRLFVCVEH
jgi:hypothetical protein